MVVSKTYLFCNQSIFQIRVCMAEYRYHSSLKYNSAGKTCEEFLKKSRAEMVPDEDLWVVCLCCHLPVSFLLPPLLLASAELLVEIQSDRAAHQGHYWSSCAQYLSPPVENQASSNTVHQATTLTLSGLIRLMAAITDAAMAVRDSRHLFICHYATTWWVG